ncbi:MAG: molybdopterin-guanine dinucleotide biosynthesis protein B [Desulfobacterales bacterium]
MTPVVSVVGKSGAGKTTLIEKIIPELKKRGYAIGILKHAFHGFDMDRKGKDSWRHRKAGADTVVVAASGSMAMFKRKEPLHLTDILHYMQDVDLIITEGFKKEKLPKIEIFRSAVHDEPLCLNSNELVAFVSDRRFESHVPHFGLEETGELADFIENTFLLEGQKPLAEREEKNDPSKTN